MDDWVCERTIFRLSNAIVGKLTARPAVEFAESVEDEVCGPQWRPRAVTRLTE